MALGEFVSSSAEETITELEDESPRTRRFLCFGGRRRDKNEPSTNEPYDIHRLPDPVRHYWRWEKQHPVCLAREATWDADEYDEALLFVFDSGMENYARAKQRRCCMKLSGDVNKRLDNAANLPAAWASVAALAPVRDPQNLQDILDRCELGRFARITDDVKGGNLMYYAASKGDLIVCDYLIQIGLGHLAAETAYDGLTAYEIAIAQGYPDTAFILMPYSGIRNVERRRFAHDRLKREMQYVVEQDGTVPKDQGPHGLLAALTSAYTRAMSAIFGDSSKTTKKKQRSEKNNVEEDSKEDSNEKNDQHKRRRSRRYSGKRHHNRQTPPDQDPSYTLFVAPARCSDLCANCAS